MFAQKQTRVPCISLILFVGISRKKAFPSAEFRKMPSMQDILGRAPGTLAAIIKRLEDILRDTEMKRSTALFIGGSVDGKGFDVISIVVLFSRR